MIVLTGTFDTKPQIFNELYKFIADQGMDMVTIHTGTFDSQVKFPVNYHAAAVAEKGGLSISYLRNQNDRGKALDVMSDGAARIVRELYEKGKVDGIIGMGGGGGTYMALKVMKALPFGIPKLCVSTLATKDLSDQIGSKDITLMPSIVDVAGLNSISRYVIRQAAGAIVGMARTSADRKEEQSKRIAISAFGNTAICVDKCTELLQDKGFDVLTFHAVGSGGQTMESLVRDGYFDAVLDITTTELADELCGGICSAGPERLTAAAEMGIPQVVAPGCLDMVNFGSMDSVLDQYRCRQLSSWAPDVTLMRTDKEENQILGKEIAEKLNKSTAPVTVLLPLGGLSKIGGKGGVFYDPEIDQELFRAIKQNINESIKIKEINENINTPEFAIEAVKSLLSIIQMNALSKGF